MFRKIIPALAAGLLTGGVLITPALAQNYDQGQGRGYSQNQPTASGDAWMNENDFDYNRRHWLPNRDQSQNWDQNRGSYSQNPGYGYDQNRNNYGQNQNGWDRNQGQYGQDQDRYDQNRRNNYGQYQHNQNDSRSGYGQNQYNSNSRDRYGDRYQQPDQGKYGSQNGLGRTYRPESRDWDDDD